MSKRTPAPEPSARAPSSRPQRAPGKAAASTTKKAATGAAKKAPSGAAKKTAKPVKAAKATKAAAPKTPAAAPAKTGARGRGGVKPAGGAVDDMDMVDEAAAGDGALQQLWRDFKEPADPPLRERLILHYSPLVKYVAERV